MCLAFEVEARRLLGPAGCTRCHVLLYAGRAFHGTTGAQAEAEAEAEAVAEAESEAEAEAEAEAGAEEAEESGGGDGEGGGVGGGGGGDGFSGVGGAGGGDGEVSSGEDGGGYGGGYGVAWRVEVPEHCDPLTFLRSLELPPPDELRACAARATAVAQPPQGVGRGAHGARGGSPHHGRHGAGHGAGHGDEAVPSSGGGLPEHVTASASAGRHKRATTPSANPSATPSATPSAGAAGRAMEGGVLTGQEMRL